MNREAISDRLREHGIGPTRQRVRIAEAMLGAPQHLSADQVMAEVNRTRPPVSKATVYNTLRLFTRNGLLREVVIDPTRIYYDSTTEPHHHFYNPRTGELVDIPAGALAVTGLPTPPPGTEAEEVEVIVRLRDRSPA